MEKGSSTRWLIIILVGLAAWFYLPKLFGSKDNEVQPIGPGKTETAEYAFAPQTPDKCEIEGTNFKAELWARHAALVDYWTTGDARFTDEKGKPIELMSVPGGVPDRYTLGFDWRSLGNTGPDAQVGKDVVDWKITERTRSSCTFTYQDDKALLTKTFRAGERPYEMVVTGTIENLSDQKRAHRLGIENTAWRTHAETESHLGRVSPFQTDVACGKDGKLDTKTLSDFAPKEFTKNPAMHDGWLLVDGGVDFASTNNAYFAQALVPLKSPGAPQCGLQVEERWYQDRYPDKTKDPDYGAMYRSRLVYPQKELAPHEKASYEVLAYFGPKDRTVLAAAAGGQHHLSELINLGTFAIISKVLVGFLVKVHGVLGNWGLSIIVLTLCVRLILFPLTWKQIQSTVAMRRLKPEVDEINRKYADDVQQKQAAMMEVYRKNGVNPFGGCLPVLVQMPVWWALYSTLQTAVELYHTPFLYFRDLSAPDPFFVLPIVIGATSFVQQKLMPQQMDAAQQKMMLYMMPAMFTVMMLFLPSGLGIYMLTNSVLGIVQQQVVERFAPSSPSGGIDVKDKTPKDDATPPSKKGDGQKLASALPAKLKG